MKADCVKCRGAADCLETNIGPVCRPCFQAAMKAGGHEGVRLFTMPEPGQTVFTVMEKPGVYVTISGVLYAFERRQDAEEIIGGLRSGYGMPDAFVEEVDARKPWGYVMQHPELNLIGIKEKIPGTPGPDGIPVPKL